ncbi:hypothetical protein FA13DRAFT_1047813 [Coprinellus micaceus]|uniref:Uncharacterized protein n=1 Tax=Coprinellus micaceus TaxID=71717 RepID=A0A4Y7RM15_COPMI|nr:hypothetical protein FA13DRAFT_1047813 [Coprinellus micaceus]
MYLAHTELTSLPNAIQMTLPCSGAQCESNGTFFVANIWVAGWLGGQRSLYLVLPLLIKKGPPPLPRVGVEGRNASEFTISEEYEIVVPLDAELAMQH